MGAGAKTRAGAEGGSQKISRRGALFAFSFICSSVAGVVKSIAPISKRTKTERNTFFINNGITKTSIVIEVLGAIYIIARLFPFLQIFRQKRK